MSRHDATPPGLMRIGIAGITDGDLPFTFTVPAAELELQEFTGDIHVEGRLRKASAQFVLTGMAGGACQFECDRCLAESKREIHAEFSILYGDELYSDEDMRVLHADQTEIAIDDDVCEALLSEIPLKLLCTEECRGLCAGCGANLNTEECRCQPEIIDERWAKLAELLKGNDTETTNN